MKLMAYLLLILLVTGCATGPLDEKKDESNVSAKTDIEDLKTVDKTYSDDLNSFSNLKRVRPKFSCSEHRTIEKTKWKDLLEAGLSCIQKEQWIELADIAKTLSHNHLKAPWGSYYRSIVAEKNGDLARSIWMADLALKKAPNNSTILFQKARVLWMTREESLAYDLMKKVVKLNEKNYDALLFLGNVHYRDREFKEALSYYKKVLKYNYKDGAFRAAMAESNFFLGKYKESLTHYKAAISKEKKNASLLYKLGLSYKNLKNWGLAKNAFEKAISQKRKGRSIASLGDAKIRTELNGVIAKIQASKGEKKKPVKIAKNKKKIEGENDEKAAK